jgi:hypothetical protein
MHLPNPFPLLAVALLSLAPAAVATDSGPRTNRFGFTGPEIFPIDYGIGNLRAADVDGDGLNDLVVVNNARSKITILYNQTGKPRAERDAAPKAKRELNELPPDARFRIDSVASEKRIAALLVTDLNGDRKPDLAYYGEPKELVIQYNDGKGGWSLPKRWSITDGQLTPNALYEGDLNGDKRTDLLLLAENHIYFFAQQADGAPGEPQKIPFNGEVKAVQALDINGDGRDDLLLVNWESQNPFRFRLQNAAGQLGPEIHFPMAPVRSYWADDLDGDRKTEVITIAMNSGRAQIFNFAQKPVESLLGSLQLGQQQILPLNKTDKTRRGIAWGDLNGDRFDDLIVSEPDSGQLTIYLQNKDGQFAPSKTFPTLAGVSDVAVADWDGDGTVEIFLLSADERQVGVTRLDKNRRVAFPTILPLEGRPLAMAVGAPKPGAKPVLAVLVDQDGKRSLVTRGATGAANTQKLAETFKSNPASLTWLDVDQDGLSDLIALIPYEKLKILRQVEGKEFEEIDIAPPGGVLEQPWASAADADGDGKLELLLGQKNFVRAVVLTGEKKPGDDKPAWSLTVRDQINGAGSNSRILAAAPLANPPNKVANLFLLDAERKTLTLCERDAAGVWQVARNLQLPVTDFTGLRPVAIGGTNANCMAFVGANAVAWMNFNKGRVWELKELDGYETPIKDGHLHDVVSGDLNHDGRKDLVFLETRKNHLDVVTFEQPHKLVPADRWQVFEERTFRSRRTDAMEPREAFIADFTGDGKNDLAVIVHDRILVYPQE